MESNAPVLALFLYLSLRDCLTRNEILTIGKLSLFLFDIDGFAVWFFFLFKNNPFMVRSAQGLLLHKPNDKALPFFKCIRSLRFARNCFICKWKRLHDLIELHRCGSHEKNWFSNWKTEKSHCAAWLGVFFVRQQRRRRRRREQRQWRRRRRDTNGKIEEIKTEKKSERINGTIS